VEADSVDALLARVMVPASAAMTVGSATPGPDPAQGNRACVRRRALDEELRARW